ncbi:DUF411 domain-containing protein [Bacteriovoracaceae bacterium]|nr:DUF411 domain-containing protein [Bacteriovoracaceae bacterium]
MSNLLVLMLTFFSLTAFAEKPIFKVYKNPSCGCCTKWVEHMQSNGFKLKEIPVPNLEELKDKFGVPKDKRSCHTAVYGNYVFEGHIPAASIKNFLKNPKGAKGLVVPDMPMGSPGMEYGSHKDKFTVFKFRKDGKVIPYDKY